MPRARNIKPGIIRNEDLAELDPLYRLGFIYSWMLADCNGVIEYRPKRLKADLFPYDEIEIHEFVLTLARSGFFTLFMEKPVENSAISSEPRKFIKINKFDRHQHPHRNEVAAGSDLPNLTSPQVLIIQQVDAVPSLHRLDTVFAPSEDGCSTELVGLIPDSGFLIPDSLIPDSGDVCENAEKSPASESETDTKNAISITETIEAVTSQFNLKKLPNPHTWMRSIEWAFSNGFSKNDFLECLTLLRSQTWRTSAVTAKTVTDNLTNLDKLRKEAAKPNHANSNTRTKTPRRITDQSTSDALAAIGVNQYRSD